MIVARNPGVAKKANSYAERLRLGLAVIHGEQKEAESDEVDGRYSPPPTRWVAVPQFEGQASLIQKFKSLVVGILFEFWVMFFLICC